MSEKTRSSPGGSREGLETLTSQDLLEQQKKLKSLGFEDISDDILTRINRDKAIKEGFESDITALLSRTPASPTEKEFFETKYIKGFGQMVTFGGKVMSVAEVEKILGNMNPTEREVAIKNGMPSRSDRTEYTTWSSKVATKETVRAQIEAQAAIKEGEKIDARTQAFTEVNKGKLQNEQAFTEVKNTYQEKLLQMNKALEEQIRSLESINGVPKPDITELRKKALEEVPELKGKAIDQAKIDNGEYDNIIKSAYYISNKDSIADTLGPKDKELFSKSISDIKGILGRPTWPEAAREDKGGIVLGTNRDAVRQAGDRAVASGYGKEVLWDPTTRSFIFRGEKGEKAIDTASVPPRERIIKNGLSIGKDLPPADPGEKERNKIQDEVSDLQSTVSKNERGLRDGMMGADVWGDIKKVGEKKPQALENYQNARTNYNKALFTDASEKLDAVNALDKANQDMDTARRKAISADDFFDGNGPKDTTTFENALGKERETILQLRKLYQPLAEKEKQLTGLPPSKPKDDTFDRTATSNLDTLISLGYDELGQERVNTIIEELNIKNRAVNGKDFIDPTLNTPIEGVQRDQLMLSIVNITRNGYKNGNMEKDYESAEWMDKWKNVDPTDLTITKRQLEGEELKLKKAVKSLKSEFNEGGIYANPGAIRSSIQSPVSLKESPSVNG